jgi:maleate isomerase
MKGKNLMKSSSRGKARIGIFVPFTNTNLEADMALLRPDGVSYHFHRLGGYDQDEIPDSDQMAGMGAASIDEALTMIEGVKPDAILYGCTSATLSHGVAFDQDLSARIKASSGAVSVTAAGALVYALSSLNVGRIGFASPYVKQLNDCAIDFLGDAGFETVSRADVVGELDNYGQGNLSPEEVFELGLRADSPEAEAIVLSCTDMRAVETVQRLEDKLGKPVVSSNQAMIFQTCQALSIDTSGLGCGQLLEIGS